MASPKGIDPKKDKIVFAGIPDWAVNLDWEYKSAILVYFMVKQIFESDEVKSTEETLQYLEGYFKGEDKAERAEFLMKLFLEHEVLKPA